MTPPALWTRWLLTACIGVTLFGLFLVIAPTLSRLGFSVMVYGDPHRLDAFGDEAARYISLAHAVMGSVMAGWGIALSMVVTRMVARGSRLGWNVLVWSLLVWFVPDTIYSLASGFWQNAVLNAAFATAFVIPLAALRPFCRDEGSWPMSRPG